MTISDCAGLQNRNFNALRTVSPHCFYWRNPRKRHFSERERDGPQKSDIAHMIWNVPEVIANSPAQYELHPGDLIFTDTPAGVGPTVPGDRLECAIDGLGTLCIGIGSKGVT